MCNNYLQETAIKISIKFSVKTYNNLKMIDMMLYIKCGLVYIKFDKLDLKVLKEIGIMITLTIKVPGMSTSFLFSFDIGFVNVIQPNIWKEEKEALKEIRS